MPLETTLTLGDTTLRHIDLAQILGERLPRLPHVLRLLAENHLRETHEAAPLLAALDHWLAGRATDFEFAFRPNRLLMHDTTCTPAIADIAGLRDAVADAGFDPRQLKPQLPVEVSVDHSLAVDSYANPQAQRINQRNEIARNAERYAFMKWATNTLAPLHVNPPGTGIMHTINLEQLATVLEVKDGFAHPDMLLGTDSHTPMINGIGVLGWGVGGLEAEGVMFGQAGSLAMPDVIGVQLTGALREGVTATDLALEITHRLRVLGVTGSFVEFFGEGVATLTADARAVIANMAPEYGASTGFFPVDGEALAYLLRTNRAPADVARIEPIFRAMGLWFSAADHPRFDREITVDLAQLGPMVAGPRRPQDRMGTAEARAALEAAIGRPLSEVHDYLEGGIPDGGISIAAITSCTNTSDPRLLVAAGLVARKARSFGLSAAPWVKTSLTPGSPSAAHYLSRAGLLEDLSALGFDIAGFGCATCIGNPGGLPEATVAALAAGCAMPAVLSGNRNFPGRVHPLLDLGFLASPPLVVAYAIAGNLREDIQTTTLGEAAGQPIRLADLWPSEAEIDEALALGFRAADVPEAFAKAAANEDWAAIDAPTSEQFPWSDGSLNIRRPKFTHAGAGTKMGRFDARPLMVLGDDMTTDHISPASAITRESPAAQWLLARGANPNDLNVYASYRGNWEVMLRGVFYNRLAQNYLAQDLPPATTVLADGARLPLFEAADRLEAEGISTVILAGERYGMGSSRDWAAKGVALLGVRAVLAKSFERIHRTNLIGMGIAPITFDAFDPKSAGITAADKFGLSLTPDDLTPRMPLEILWQRGASVTPLAARLAVETRAEVDLLRQGGVLAAILNSLTGQG